MKSTMLTLLTVVQAMIASTVCAPLTGGAEKIQPGYKTKAPMVSVERELQALVGSDMLGEPRQSMFSKQQSAVIPPQASQQKVVAPADLARAASLHVGDRLAPLSAVVQTADQQGAPATSSPISTGNDPDSAGPYSAVNQLLNADLTPHAVAEYLLITGEFRGFEAAIADLLRAKIISPSEAKQYKDAVGWEYEALLYKLVNAKETSLQEFMRDNQILTTDENAQAKTVEVFSSPPRTAEPLDDTFSRGQIDDELRRLQVSALLEKEATLDELINAISQRVSVEEGNTQEIDPAKDLTETIELLSQAIEEAAPANVADVYQVRPNVPAESLKPGVLPQQPQAAKIPPKTNPAPILAGAVARQQPLEGKPKGGVR